MIATVAHLVCDVCGRAVPLPSRGLPSGWVRLGACEVATEAGAPVLIRGADICDGHEEVRALVLALDALARRRLEAATAARAGAAGG